MINRLNPAGCGTSWNDPLGSNSTTPAQNGGAQQRNDTQTEHSNPHGANVIYREPPFPQAFYLPGTPHENGKVFSLAAILPHHIVEMAMNLKRFKTALRLLVTNRPEFLRKVRRMTMRRPPFYRKRLSMRIDDWILYHHNELLFTKPKYMGIAIQKNPMDLWIYQEMIYEIRPDILLEIGSGRGSSSLYFAHLFDLLGAGTVITIDQHRFYFEVQHPRIVPVTGDCGSQEVHDEVARLCEGKRVMVIHDATHTREAVERDLELYSHLVPPGSYFVVEDGISDLFYPGDGLGYWEEWGYYATRDFVARHPNWEIDLERERYIITYNPHGFLKRLS